MGFSRAEGARFTKNRHFFEKCNEDFLGNQTWLPKKVKSLHFWAILGLFWEIFGKVNPFRVSKFLAPPDGLPFDRMLTPQI